MISVKTDSHGRAFSFSHATIKQVLDPFKTFILLNFSDINLVFRQISTREGYFPKQKWFVIWLSFMEKIKGSERVWAAV